MRQLSLTLSWEQPPIRAVQPIGRERLRLPRLDPPPWLETGPHGQPFDFAGHMRRLVDDVTRRCATFQHIQVDQLLFGFTQARSGRSGGLQARVTPLRFGNGQLVRPRRGIRYQVQRYVIAGQEYLYLMTFCLPRFLNREFDDKLVTLFHELYHISPDFDGDLRRHHGRCSVHSRSKRAYDKQMAGLAREYLASKPDPILHAFLRLDFGQLVKRHGCVQGIFVPRPKLVPLNGQIR